ncbi:hypothetical protein ACRAWF_21170 [Streptomyces sp. L7]
MNPLLRPLSAAGGFVLERWADEEAAVRVGDRCGRRPCRWPAALATSANRSRPARGRDRRGGAAAGAGAAGTSSPRRALRVRRGRGAARPVLPGAWPMRRPNSEQMIETD